MKRLAKISQQSEVFKALLLASAVSSGLLVIRMIASGSTRFWFLLWNLFLAWIPLLLSFIIKRSVTARAAIGWPQLLIFILWLAFLPNSFYIMSDLIHLQSSGEVSVLYDTAIISSFVINGLLLGYISLNVVQNSVARITGKRIAFWFAQAILLLSSFAIYLGRYLRWNSWDVVLNPAGLLFDVSDRFINPVMHSDTFITTAVFYVVLGSFYVVGRHLMTANK